MNIQRVLVVDDEKNIRFTLAAVLQDMGLQVATAASGEEALARLDDETYELVFLDLKMPGLSGLDVLRRLRSLRPETQVIIITAHGTIERAVEAMKLGAVDFIQKPFSVGTIRALVTKVRERGRLDPAQTTDYDAYTELARRSITRQQFDAAREYLQQAQALDDARPEAYNLLGVLYEIDGDRFQAQQHYREALQRDPAYEPARANVHSSVEPGAEGSFMLEAVKKSDVEESPDA